MAGARKTVWGYGRTVFWLTFVLAGSTAAQTTERHPTILPPEPIDWPAVAQDYDADYAARMTDLNGFINQRRAFDKTTLPVLLPAPQSGISLRQMTFSSFGDAYGMELPQEQSAADLTIVITATRSFVAAASGTFNPADFETLTIGDHTVKALFEETESGWTASFPLYGALYTVDLDCGDQGKQSPCRDPDHIRRITASLNEVVLGTQALRLLPVPLTAEAEDRGNPRRVRGNGAPPRGQGYRRGGGSRPDPPPTQEPSVRDTPPPVKQPTPAPTPPTEQPVPPVSYDTAAPTSAPAPAPAPTREKPATNSFMDWLRKVFAPANDANSVR